jgi:hypothetical protein
MVSASVSVVSQALEVVTATVGHVYIGGANGNVVGCGMVFTLVVSLILFAGTPVYFELALADSVTYPVVAHVDSLGTFLFYRVVCNAGGGAVVCLYWRRRLRVPQFF